MEEQITYSFKVAVEGRIYSFGCVAKDRAEAIKTLIADLEMVKIELSSKK